MAVTNKEPIYIGYWCSGDPCKKLAVLERNLLRYNVIETKNLTDEFIEWLLNKHKTNEQKIFIHLHISGMNGTEFEPNIQSVRTLCEQIHKLISGGFPKKRFQITIKPIIPNLNGIKALELFLKLFTEYKQMRLRSIRFELLSYYKYTDDKTRKQVYNISSKTIRSRLNGKPHLKPFLVHIGIPFYVEYNKLKTRYNNIIQVVEDYNTPKISHMELKALGLGNTQPDGVTKIIDFNIPKTDPQKFVKIISNPNPVRCSNMCVLCPYK